MKHWLRDGRRFFVDRPPRQTLSLAIAAAGLAALGAVRLLAAAPAQLSSDPNPAPEGVSLAAVVATPATPSLFQPASTPTTNEPPATAAPTAAEEPTIKEYIVRRGDTLKTIAEKFGLSTEALAWSNDLREPDKLMEGERLLVPSVPGVIHRGRPGDTPNSVAALYQVEVAKIISTNSLAAPFLLRVDQHLLVPGAKLPQPTPQPAPTVAPTQPPDSAAPPPNAAAAVEVKPAPTEQPRPSSPQEAFILEIAAAAQASQKATGIPASVTMAQAILESFWGQSRLAREAKNYFGIKAHTKPGSAGVYWMDAWEVINGRNVVRREPFRAYASVADSFADHAQFLVENPRYASAFAVKNDPRQFARELARAGYATDPAYASKLISLMDQYNLYRFNE